MQFKVIAIDLNKLKELLGPPPVLSTESVQAYYAMQFHYMEALTPRDFFQQMLVKDLVDADWESLRFKRHKALAIERRDRKWRELQASHKDTSERKKVTKDNAEKPETDSERLQDLDLQTEELGLNCIKLAEGLMTPSMDMDLSRAMEEAISLYERLDKLEKDSLAKRVIIFEQIRLYEQDLYLKARNYAAYVSQIEDERRTLEILEHAAAAERAAETK